MDNRINVEAIIKKNIHQKITEDQQSDKYFENIWLIWWGIMDTGIKEGLQAAIKEIAEAVVTQCSETPSAFSHKPGKLFQRDETDKQSILNVKQLIDYE